MAGFSLLRRALAERLARGESRAFASAELRGLPMDEASRMTRAREMGFDVETPLYHGSASTDIESFMPNGGGAGSEEALGRFRTAVENDDPYGYMNFRSGSFFSPDPEYAANYTGEASGAIYPVLARIKNPVIFDQNGRLPARIAQPGKTPDALVMMQGDKVNEVAIIDPANIRSRFAAFDPSRSNRRNLLAGLAVAAPVSGITLREALAQRQ